VNQALTVRVAAKNLSRVFRDRYGLPLYKLLNISCEKAFMPARNLKPNLQEVRVDPNAVVE